MQWLFCFAQILQTLVTILMYKNVFDPLGYSASAYVMVSPERYRKIPKISPGAYIFQRPFLRGLSTEGNLRFKIDWASLIVGSKFAVFALSYFVFEGNFPSTSPRGLIFGGAI